MTNEAQQIAIAEACGITHIEDVGYQISILSREIYGLWGQKDGERLQVPNYPADLNAMHEAEKTLTDVQRDSYYYDYLHVKDEDHSWTASAPAAKRAEAFLRTIGKWKD